MAFRFRRSRQQADATVDRLTGAFNRRRFDADIAAGLDIGGTPTATLMVTVDDFDSYAGRSGAASGDQVLERVAWVIMATVRTTDIVYRHDESTFCVLLPSTSDAEALAVASRIGVNIEKMPVLSECGVSISAGVASTRVTGGDVRSAVDRALAALGDAVRSGKGPIVADGGDGEPGASDMAPVPRPVRPVPTRIAASRQFAALPTPSAETPFVPPASGPAHVVSRTS